MTSTLPPLTPELLTAALRAQGRLVAGAVTSAEVVEQFETPPSLHARLALTFATGSAGDAPTRLLLKVPKPHKRARGRRELRFYAEVAPQMPGFPLVPCAGALELPPDDLPVLLLDDLSATHAAVPRAALAWEHIEAMAGLLARLHAHWWDHPALPAAAGEQPQARLAADLVNLGGRHEEFLALHGERLTPSARHLFARYVADGPALLLARARRGPLTLCHPDSHEGNVLFPRGAGGGPYMIDWHGYQQWWGPADLAVLVNRCVPASLLGRRDDLLRRYHEELLRWGVTGYSLADCREDYRLGVVDYLAAAIGYRRWEPWVERHLPPLLHEAEALACADLLAPGAGA